MEDAIAAADAAAAVRDQVQHQQQQQQQRSFTRSGSSSSSSDEEDLAVLLTSAADKLYKQRLRELHALMSAEGLQQLRLTPQQYDSLQVVLSDLQDLRASWDEEGSGDQEEGDGADELTPAEAALVQQLSSSPLMPDDFHSYLLAFLPEGSGAADVQQLMQRLDPAVLRDIQGVYRDLKQFERADMDLPEAQERYVELSAKITAVADRVQSILVSYNSNSSSKADGSFTAAVTPTAVASYPQPSSSSSSRMDQTAVVVESSSSGGTSSSSSSGGSGSGKAGRSWGSSWAKPRGVQSTVGQPVGRNNSSNNSQQQHLQQQQQQAAGVPQQNELHKHQAAHAGPPQQQLQEQQLWLVAQQQQQRQQQAQESVEGDGLTHHPRSAADGISSAGDRTRRRRSIIRRNNAAAAVATA